MRDGGIRTHWNVSLVLLTLQGLRSFLSRSSEKREMKGVICVDVDAQDAHPMEKFYHVVMHPLEACYHVVMYPLDECYHVVLHPRHQYLHK